MEYKIENKISGIRIVESENGTKILFDYTISGTGTHKGVALNINSGISIEAPNSEELINLVNEIAEKQISETYKND